MGSLFIFQKTVITQGPFTSSNLSILLVILVFTLLFILLSQCKAHKLLFSTLMI